ncbi:hypothetical protein ACXR2T_07795 [Leucobacter sp. HY1910]
MFTASDYAPFVYGSGADKLADSQIAPLVAAVRGYRSFTDPDSSRAAINYSVPDGRKNASTYSLSQVNEYLANDGDIMMMPWYSTQAVSLTTDEQFPRMMTCQMRPKHAQMDSDGRPKKYLFPPKSTIPVSLHPGFTKDWMNSAPRVIITEGVIKEDALLTAMMLSSGIPEEALKLPPLTESEADEWRRGPGRDQLRAQLMQVPSERRLLPMGVPGVHGWSESNFGPIAMDGREIVIAFDGDTTTNPAVHQAFSKLWDAIGIRNGRPRLLDLGSDAALAQIRAVPEYTHIGVTDAAGKRPMLGVDDFLSHIGTFDELLSYITDRKPPRPSSKADGYQSGDWRVSPDGCVVEELRVTEEFEKWQDRIYIGGRIDSISIKRSPDPSELRTGIRNESFDGDAESIATMTLNWKGQAGKIHTCTFDLDVGLLSAPPDRWGHKLSTLPPGLVMHADWPPRGDTGMKWLSAIKAASEGHEVHYRWEATGWVPGKNEPVFVIGDQALGETREDEQASLPHPEDTVIPSAGRFGVHDTYWDLVDPYGGGEVTDAGLAAYKAQVVADIDTVVRSFLLTNVWPERGHYGAVILGAALRPTIPERPRASVFFAGPPKTGKSYCAAMGMGAWQREAGVWTSQSLPGSATDTKYATERLMSACGTLWVIDDLAPSASASQAVQVQQMVEDMVRSSFNGTSRSKGGGTMANGSMGLAQQTPPRAQLFVTAENALTTNSARGRTIQLDFVDGVVDHDASIALYRDAIDSLALSRVCAAMIRSWHIPHTTPGKTEESANAITWEERVKQITPLRDAMKAVMNEVLEADHGISGGDSDRQMTMTCDLLLTYRYLLQLYMWAGGQVVETLAALNIPNTLEMFRETQELVSQGHYKVSAPLDLVHMSVAALGQGKEQAIGRTLIDCIADVIAAGKAHLLNPNVAGAPPFPDTPENLHLNRAAGWEKVRGEWTGRGESIGQAGQTNNGMMALLNPTNAFQIAQKLHPSRIPFGQKPEATWHAAAAEGVVMQLGEGRTMVQVRIGEPDPTGTRPRGRGVMVPLEQLLREEF